MATQSIDTMVGQRRIDTENKLIETGAGDMVSYISTQPMTVDGTLYIAYMVNANAGVLVTQQAHAKLNEISEEQKQKNLNAQDVEMIQTEGYGY